MAAQDKKRKGKARITAAQAYKLGNRAAVNKARTAKRVKKETEKRIAKNIRRARNGKPMRGHARTIRRERERATQVAA